MLMVDLARKGQKILGVLLSMTAVACGTTANPTEVADVITFTPPDAKADLPIVPTDSVTDTPPDAGPDLQELPDVSEVAEEIDVADVLADLPPADTGTVDVYVPQCVTDTQCDDKNGCTVDLCANETCKNTAIPGCCNVDADCPKAPTCKSAKCVANSLDPTGAKSCKNETVANCCASGPCCDSGTQQAKMPMAPCTDIAAEFQFDCQGSDIYGRRAVLGCDGKVTAACSGNTANFNWTEWNPVATCPAGSLCNKKPEKSQFPSCSGNATPGCLSDIGCEDGDLCTVDNCEVKSGNCIHTPASATTLCGSTALFTEYTCISGAANSETGGGVGTRTQYASCGTDGKCGGKGVWTPWTVIQSCESNEKCDVPISTEPGTCTPVPVCKPGTTCCDGNGQFAAMGTACGTTTVATEYQCDSATAKGAKYSVRTGTSGCAGTSSNCSAATPAWGDWKPAGKCAINQLCTVPVANMPAVCADVCQANSMCCNSGGDWADQGTKCADQLQKTVTKCSSTAGVDSVLSSQIFPGCTGVDATCSVDAANVYATAYSILKECQSYEKCKQNGDVATCVANTPCTPGSQCCTADGQWAPPGSQCQPTGGTQYSCSSNIPGASVLQRQIYYGCSGDSAACSFDLADITYTPWVTKTDCQANEVCIATSDMTAAECNSNDKCVPGSICCDGSGQFLSKGTKCGTIVQKTLYQCENSELGASIQKAEYYAGCTGIAADCSSTDAQLVQYPSVWLNATTCQLNEYCWPPTPSNATYHCDTKPPP